MPGDTILVLDGALDRIYWATADDGIVRVRQLQGALPPRASYFAGILDDHSIVLFGRGSSPPVRPKPTPVPGLAPVVVLSAGAESRMIAEVPSGLYVDVHIPQGGTSIVRGSAVILAPRAQAVVWDSVIAITSGNRYRIELHAPRGARLGIIEMKTRRRPVDDAMRGSLIEESLRASRISGGDRPDRAAWDDGRRESRLIPLESSVRRCDRAEIAYRVRIDWDTQDTR